MPFMKMHSKISPAKMAAILFRGRWVDKDREWCAPMPQGDQIALMNLYLFCWKCNLGKYAIMVYQIWIIPVNPTNYLYNILYNVTVYEGLDKDRDEHYPDSKVHRANMGPTWVLSAPDRLHVVVVVVVLHVPRSSGWLTLVGGAHAV